MQIEACIFDLDGVIVDTAYFHFIAWTKLARKFGGDLSKERNEMLKGVSRRGSLERILQWIDRSLTEDEMVYWMQKKNNWYLEMVEKMTPADILPGASSFIDRLRTKGYKIAIGSSSKNTPVILSKVGLSDHFDAIVHGGMVEKGKPDPAIFTLGAKLLDVAPENTIVFEDARSGIRAAKTGGFIAIGVGDSPLLNEADLVIDSLREIRIEEILLKLDQLSSKV